MAKSLDGTIVAWNPAAQRMYGYSESEAVGKHISFLFPKDKRDELGPILQSRRGERVEHYETVRVSKDGARIDVSMTISPILGRGGKILGASAIDYVRLDQEPWLSRVWRCAIIGRFWHSGSPLALTSRLPSRESGFAPATFRAETASSTVKAIFA